MPSAWSLSHPSCSEWTSSASLCAHLLCSCHWAPLKTTSPPLLPPFRYSFTLMTFALSILFSRPNRPRPFLIGQMLQSIHHLYGPLVDSLHYGHVSFVLVCPEQDTGLSPGVTTPALNRNFQSLSNVKKLPLIISIFPFHYGKPFHYKILGKISLCDFP